jgi:hypothetical protein
MVRSGGQLTAEHLKGKPAIWGLSTKELVKRGYLKNVRGGYAFRIEYLYHFLQRRLDLLVVSPTNPSPSLQEPLRIAGDKIYRGQKLIELNSDELKCVLYLNERRGEELVLINHIYSHVYAGRQAGGTERWELIKRLIDSVRRKIGDDSNHPHYITGFNSGYRLDNVE